jgi:hypothetical protein
MSLIHPICEGISSLFVMILEWPAMPAGGRCWSWYPVIIGGLKCLDMWEDMCLPATLAPD